MRIDFAISILLALVSIPLGAAIMAAPLYWNIPRQYLALFVWGGFALTFALIVAVVLLALRSEASFAPTDYGRRVALGMMILFLIGVCCSASVYFWPAIHIESAGGTGVEVDRPERPILFAECSPGTTLTAPDRVFWVPIGPTVLPNLTGGFAINTGENQHPVTIGEDSYGIYKCSIKNYGKEPAFNLKVTLRIIYKGSPDKGFDENTPIIVQRDYRVVINAVDNDPKNPFVFYIVNIENASGYVDILPNVIYDCPGQIGVIGTLSQPLPRYSRMLLLGKPADNEKNSQGSQLLPNTLHP